MLGLLKSIVRMCIYKITEEEIRADFAVAAPTANVTATVHGKCLVKMEMALNLCVEDMDSVF